MAELVQVADPEEIPPLVESLKRNRSKSVSLLKEIFDEIYPVGESEQQNEEAPPSQTVSRLARLAIGLWLLDAPQAAFKAFRYSSDLAASSKWLTLPAAANCMRLRVGYLFYRTTNGIANSGLNCNWDSTSCSVVSKGLERLLPARSSIIISKTIV